MKTEANPSVDAPAPIAGRAGRGGAAGGAGGESAEQPEEAVEQRSWKAALAHEVRSHPFGYGVLAVALVVGPILLRMIFPEITTVQAIVGGLAFGVYAALCAVPQKFM